MVLAENVMAAIWELAMVAQVLMAMRNWSSDLWLKVAACKWGRLHMRSSQSSFQDENSTSGLNWLCLAIVLLKALFLRAWAFFRVKI
jgi:hypothetical protein